MGGVRIVANPVCKNAEMKAFPFHASITPSNYQRLMISKSYLEI